MTASTVDFTERLKAEALKEGFARVGVCDAGARPELDRLHDWLEAGYDGRMDYIRRRLDAYADPTLVLDDAQSIVMLTRNYAGPAPVEGPESTSDEPEPASAAPRGRVSRYAAGLRDYHDVIHESLKRLRRFVQAEHPHAKVRGVVDTAPLLERDYARLAGLGWIGKNTMLIHREDGSWFFLAALLTDLLLQADPPMTTDHCGVCRACLDACPTDAFPEPYVLDARRCISYLTIELRESIPESLRSGVGDWVFGCDICQDVCPWNRRAAVSLEDDFRLQPALHRPDLLELLAMDDASFHAAFRKTPLWRAKRAGVLRNAAVALGNLRRTDAIPALRRALSDEEPLVRGAAVWALGQIGDSQCRAALSERAAAESDPQVLDEISAALARLHDNGA